MPESCCSWNDGVLFGALGYSTVILINKWDRYEACGSHPLQLFLLVDYILILVFRLVHFAEKFWEYHRRVSRYLLLLKLGVLFPFLVVWTAIGTYWFEQSGDCLPENNQYWTLILWLVLCYLWIFFYVFLRIFIIPHQRTHGVDGIDNENGIPPDMLLLHLRPQDQAPGLSNEDMNTLPDVDATPEFQDQECTICLDCYLPGDKLKMLPACGHHFHTKCIRAWLMQNATCPLCRVSVRALQETLDMHRQQSEQLAREQNQQQQQTPQDPNQGPSRPAGPAASSEVPATPAAAELDPSELELEEVAFRNVDWPEPVTRRHSSHVQFNHSPNSSSATVSYVSSSPYLVSPSFAAPSPPAPVGTGGPSRGSLRRAGRAGWERRSGSESLDNSNRSLDLSADSLECAQVEIHQVPRQLAFGSSSVRSTPTDH